MPDHHLILEEWKGISIHGFTEPNVGAEGLVAHPLIKFICSTFIFSVDAQLRLFHTLLF